MNFIDTIHRLPIQQVMFHLKSVKHTDAERKALGKRLYFLQQQKPIQQSTQQSIKQPPQANQHLAKQAQPVPVIQKQQQPVNDNQMNNILDKMLDDYKYNEDVKLDGWIITHKEKRDKRRESKTNFKEELIEDANEPNICDNMDNIDNYIDGQNENIYGDSDNREQHRDATDNIGYYSVDKKYIEEISNDELNNKLMSRLNSDIDIFSNKSRGGFFETPFVNTGKSSMYDEEKDQFTNIYDRKDFRNDVKFKPASN
jgi:hypothetical protein